MVNQNQEPEAVQASLPITDEFASEVNPLIAETERLNNIPDPVESVTEVTPVPDQPVIETTAVEGDKPEEPVVEETPAIQDPAVPDPNQQINAQQVAELQRQAAEYEQVRQRAAVQQEQQRIQAQLEARGATPEEAHQQASAYAQSQQAQQDLMKKADEYGKHIVAKQNAAEHFAIKYKLTLEDLPILRQADNETVMENIAQQITERRKKDDELERFRKAQVPAQQFDNSQGAPEVASSDGNWLDRYTNGDRSPNAVAAVKRMMGID